MKVLNYLECDWFIIMIYKKYLGLNVGVINFKNIKKKGAKGHIIGTLYIYGRSDSVMEINKKLLQTAVEIKFLRPVTGHT